MKNIIHNIQIKKLSPKAMIPKKGSELAAGYDLYSIEKTTVPKKSKALVSTGLTIAIPEGFYGRIAPRSGLAWKNFIDVGAGVVDADYRGEVKVLLFNFSEEDFEINEGDRIAQLIIQQIAFSNLIEVEDLNETERNEKGFGSTGTK